MRKNLEKKSEVREKTAESNNVSSTNSIFQILTQKASATSDECTIPPEKNPIPVPHSKHLSINDQAATTEAEPTTQIKSTTPDLKTTTETKLNTEDTCAGSINLHVKDNSTSHNIPTQKTPFEVKNAHHKTSSSMYTTSSDFTVTSKGSPIALADFLPIIPPEFVDHMYDNVVDSEPQPCIVPPHNGFGEFDLKSMRKSLEKKSELRKKTAAANNVSCTHSIYQVCTQKASVPADEHCTDLSDQESDTCSTSKISSKSASS